MELVPASSPDPVRFSADDGTTLAYHLAGRGELLVCLPGGPMLDADYLGDLGGLTSQRELALLDPRGTGASAAPADAATCRCDRQVADLEALRHHLGLETMTVLAHSAGANVAYRYAEQHADRLERLVLVTPSVRAFGIDVMADARRAVIEQRAGEPWHAAAAAAFERVQDDLATDADWAAITPLTFGRWDEEAAAYDARMDARRNNAAAEMFGAEGAFDPPVTTAALAELDVPALVLAGEWDVGNPPSVMAAVARLLPRGELVVQPRAGHYPWRDDPAAFRDAVGSFLAG